MPSLLQQLKTRGCVHDISHFDTLEKFLGNNRICFYCGFDPTASSLHVGSLLPLLLMRRLQNAGHRPIALIGSATGMIGDPSGKSEERGLRKEEEIQENSEGLRKQISRILSSEGENAFMLVQNGDWLRELSYISFLRDVGKHFSVNSMIAKESVKSRLENREQGISYTEFSYMLLQAYDYYWLNKEYGCRLQVGGSDQWGNITEGMELIRRVNPENHPQVYGLTFPLLMTSTGTKFGKTEKGTVWLDPERTSPYHFYQFWLNTADADVLKYISLFTELEETEIVSLGESLVDYPEKRDSQKVLASKLTELLHGSSELKNAISASEVLFGGAITNLDSSTLLDIFSEVPSTELPTTECAAGTSLADLLVRSEIAQSKGAARRLIEGGGLYINNEKCTDAKTNITLNHFIEEKVLVIRSGKKNYYLIKAS